MSASELALLRNLRTISRYSIVLGLLISLTLKVLGAFPIELQVVLALIALAVGIPHGAVDHIVTVPKFSRLKTILFFAGYLGVVALAIYGILAQNSIGFQLVVLMSAIHFGVGDAAFISEIDQRAKSKRSFPKWIYAIAAGFIPVVIPLVSAESTQALQRVNPKLIAWSGSLAPAIFIATVGLAGISILAMVIAKRWQEVLDLSLLTALALIAPPLVAFAFYFGLWHALRHTGRLTLELASSQLKHKAGLSSAAFFKAFLAGIPALIATVAFALFLGLTRNLQLGQDFLWYLLVVVWALTVPHMALTARMDLRALRPSSRALGSNL
jgi:Brp/Blh family beta-carotene 15,15'-monooxygenase